MVFALEEVTAALERYSIRYKHGRCGSSKTLKDFSVLSNAVLWLLPVLRRSGQLSEVLVGISLFDGRSRRAIQARFLLPLHTSTDRANKNIGFQLTRNSRSRDGYCYVWASDAVWQPRPG